jgi:hypothetical protein
MGNMIDTLFMRNVTLKGRTSKATEASLDDANQVLFLLYFVLSQGWVRLHCKVQVEIR